MSEVTGWIEKIQGYAEAIGYSLAGLCVVILAIILITGGRNALEKGKGMAVGIIAGIGVLAFGIAFIQTLQG